METEDRESPSSPPGSRVTEAISEAERATLHAVLARLIPADDRGPGAIEAGVARYVEGALAGEYGAQRAAYAAGLADLGIRARRTSGRPFPELTAREQDALLEELEREGERAGRELFELVRQHALEGMFGDPAWGGNADRAGWKLLGYPGPRPVWTAEEQQLDAAVPPAQPDALPTGARVTAARTPVRGRTPAASTADVVLVGLGAACGVAAHVLTEAGLEVVALEAGPWRDPSEMTFDEIRNDVREWLAQPKAAHEVPTWRSSSSEVAGPSPWPMLMVNAVGGSTVHYPALSARLGPWNFRSRSQIAERYGAGTIPEGSTVADWPFGYDELEPYYDLVEQAIGVAGSARNVEGEVDPRGNPFEGPRKRGYPLPPLRRTGWTELMRGAAESLGWHPFPAPAALNSEPYNGNPACTYCGYCTYNGCHVGAKGSADATVIRRALATGRLTIRTMARVVRIEADGGGRVTGVTYVEGGRTRFQPAAAVLLGAFAYENVRLLLLSRSDAYPRGLANNNGQVGRHYMAHAAPVLFGRFPGRRLNLWSGPWVQATCLDDWNADNFDHSGLGFVGGAMLSAPHELKPVAAATQPLPPRVPRWGSDWKRWLQENAGSVGSVNAQMECLSYEGNRVDLDPVATDPYGLPVTRVTFQLGENERRGYAFMVAKLEEWMRAAGASETWSRGDSLLDPRHCYGGTRMGDDPKTSVVDRFGFSPEAPNLGVLGASTFPTTGGLNPTLTVQALAWRTAAHLVRELGGG